MVDIAWFKELSNKDVSLVGGKGASLAEMYNIGLPVPPGFLITAEAYKKFLETDNLKDKIKKILDIIDVSKTEELREKSKEIKDLMINTKMSEDLKNEIIEAYDNLNIDDELATKASKDAMAIINSGKEPPFVAVRSSATAEDLPEASFAGQQETYLNIKGDEELLDAVRKCWASLFTSRAIFYREKHKFDHMQVYLCVVVQRMVNSYSSGVMFSINPATNKQDEIIIEAGYGLGEAIVSGAINPDLYIINKEDLKIKEKKVAKQTWQFIKDPRTGKTIKKDIPIDLQDKQVVPDSIILSLAEFGKKIENHYKKPQDIEWAIEDNRLYIVQSRPVTTLKEEVKQTEAIVGEVLISGLSASAGVVVGRVKVVHDDSEFGKIEKGDILVTAMTKPSMVPLMEKSAAIVTNEGGLTAHAAIVSRELGVPCIVGTQKATEVLQDGMEVTVDATEGKVYKGDVIKEKGIEITEKTEDGEEIETSTIETTTQVKAIVDIPEIAERAAKTKADGVGLVRAEFMLAGTKVHPGKLVKEDKDALVNQLADGISKIAEAFKGKPVWYRTLDMRSDEYTDLEGGEEEPKEDNPMMGWHGIRRDLEQPELLKAQFEAIKKVHDMGSTNVGIMLPLVINVDEIKKAKEIMRECGLEPLDEVEFGVMIETPASVQIIEDICKEEVDFVSFGTNDLTQFTLALDRNNAKVQNLYNEMHSAVLKEIKHVIEVCKKYNVETSICGQAGSNPEMAEFLVKTGIDSISANSDSVAKIRRIVAKVEKRLLLDAARRMR